MAEFSQNKYCQGPWIEEQTIINTNIEFLTETLNLNYFKRRIIIFFWYHNSWNKKDLLKTLSKIANDNLEDLWMVKIY